MTNTTNDKTETKPLPLTDDQATQVSGGLMVRGCPACTSGRPAAFANLAASVG